jgi:hypothetical protein
MQTSSISKWPALATLGLLVAAGALVVCKTTPGCYLSAQPREETILVQREMETSIGELGSSGC